MIEGVNQQGHNKHEIHAEEKKLILVLFAKGAISGYE